MKCADNGSKTTECSATPTDGIKNNFGKTQLNYLQYRKEHNILNERDKWNACSMSKERTIVIQPILLTPKAACKIRGNSSTNLNSLKSYENSVKQKSSDCSSKKNASQTSESTADDALFLDSDAISPNNDSINQMSRSDFDSSFESGLLAENTNSTSSGLSAISSLSKDGIGNNAIFLECTKEKEDVLQMPAASHSSPVSHSNNDQISNDPYIHSCPETSADTDSADQMSELSSYSLSSSYGQDALHQAKTIECSNCSKQHHAHEIETYKMEIKELKDSLKLANADTAILVSAKQQLQLDYLDTNEMNDSLKMEVEKLNKQLSDERLNITSLKRNFSINEVRKNSMETMDDLKNDLKRMTAKYEESHGKLKDVSAQNQLIQKKLSDVSHQFAETIRKNEKLEEEVSQLLPKCVKLEYLENQVAVEDTRNNDYIKFIRTERDNLASKLQSKELVLTQMEGRLEVVRQENATLVASHASTLKSLNENEHQLATLRSLHAAKDEEKRLLDGAMARLRNDLGRVETSFEQMKTELSQCVAAHQQEVETKQRLESELAALKLELGQAQKDSVSFSLKISDKNNQLSQLSSQLKRAFLAKRKHDSEIASLKSQLSLQQLSLASGQEEALKSQVEELSRIIADKDELIHSTRTMVETLKTDQGKYQNSFEEKCSQVSKKDGEVMLLQKKLENLRQSQKESDNLLDVKDKMIVDLEDQLSSITEANSSMKDQIQLLKNSSVSKVESTQQIDDDNYRQMNDVITQLQASRRELFERISQIEEKKKFLQDENERLKKEKKKMEADGIAMKEANETLSKHIDGLQQKSNEVIEELRASRSSEASYCERLAEATRTCSVLRNELNRSESEFQTKTNEVTSLLNSNKLLADELETAKSEMNAANLRYVTLMSDDRRHQDDAEKVEMFERLRVVQLERDKLNEAVTQQQRYIVSLQAHYQKWIGEVAAHYQQLQADAAGRRTNATSLCDASCQTSHEEKPVPSTPVRNTPVMFLTLDVACQTSHDEKPVSSSPLKSSSVGAIEHGKSDSTRITSEASSSDIIATSLQTTDTFPNVISASADDVDGDREQSRFFSGAARKTSVLSSNESGVASHSLPVLRDVSTEACVEVIDASAQTERNAQLCDFDPSLAGNALSSQETFQPQNGAVSDHRNSSSRNWFGSRPHSSAAPTTESSSQTLAAMDEARSNDRLFDASTCTEPLSVCDFSVQVELLEPEAAVTCTPAFCDVAMQTDFSFNSKSTGCLSVVPSAQLVSASTQTSLESTVKTQIHTQTDRFTLIGRDACTQTSSRESGFHRDESSLNEHSTSPSCLPSTATTSSPPPDNHTTFNHSQITPLPHAPSHGGVVHDAGTQTTAGLQGTSLPVFPDPRDVLNQFTVEDRAKLKAYKQTVKVVRAKLKRVESQLESTRNDYDALKSDFEALQSKSNDAAELDPLHVEERGKARADDERLIEELDQWKDSNRQQEVQVQSLKEELTHLRKRHDEEVEMMRRKWKTTRMVKERKMKETNDRLKLLVDTNERLTTTVDKLQVKLTSRSRELDSCQKERIRHQQRARKLQADLRSLSWLANGPNDESKADVTEVKGSRTVEEQCSAMPSSVREIDTFLKDLRKEISVLEKQLDHHSSAVRRSSVSLKEIRNLDPSSPPRGSEAIAHTLSVAPPSGKSIGTCES